MSTASFLHADFGSESEDDNFNPAPADDSDNEAAGDSDDGLNSRSTQRNGDHKHRVSDNDRNGGKDHRSPKEPPQRNGTQDNDDGENVAAGINDSDPDIGNGAGGGEEDDEDDDDEEEDEEEDISGRPRKRTRRDHRNQYLDVEAEVDESDEPDEDDDDGLADAFIADTHPDDFADLPVGAETDDRRHRELDRRREMDLRMDAEKQAEILNARYSSKRAQANDSVTVPKRLLLPSVEDPSIWGVKCKPGKEKEIVHLLTKRIEERARTRTPVPILSAFEREHMISYVYIEARKRADVDVALAGMSNIFPRVGCVLVPIKEMPDLLRVTKSKQLQPGGYVRMKRGKYAGDLAQIDDVETNGLEVTLRIVPRLDYGINEDAEGVAKGDSSKRKRAGVNGKGLNNGAGRPPQRLFSEVEAKKRHSKSVTAMNSFKKKHWIYFGDTYINGFLIKDFKIQNLLTKDVNPTLEEVTRFTAGAEDGTENLDLAALLASVKNTRETNDYEPGDMVEVYQGEQQGVRGKAVSMRGDIVTMSVTTGDLQGQSIEVPIKGLRKIFREGEHVKVIGASRYWGEVGMVVRIKDDTVTILSDVSMEEITVFSKDLREASQSDIPGGWGLYDPYDLVQLDASTVGCIIKVDRESLRVLDQNGSVRSAVSSQIANKISQRRDGVATDRNGSEIRLGDTVREVGGEQKQGKILHIHRSFLFLYNRQQTDHAGISVVRANNVMTVAAKGGRVIQGANSGPDLTRMNPALQRNSAGANANTAMPPPRAYGRDRCLGQTVTVRKGPYKGLLGLVTDTTDHEARVELHTKALSITLPKDHLGFRDPINGSPMDFQRFSAGRGRGDRGRGGFPGATPGRAPDWSGGRTPMVVPQGGRTPAWGASSRTPAWNGGSSSSRTPMWRQDGMSGNRTPAYGGADGGRTVNPYADGNRTAYGGTAASGGRTPAWDPGARTSYGDSTGGSKTPAYNADSSRTPAYNGNASTTYNDSWGSSANATTSNTAANSRPYDAPTPGKDIHAAPTPSNGYSAATPAAAAQTPKFSGYAAEAPTPFSGQPETPAWGGEEVPNYDEGTPSP
ncbi:transcription elongation factor spt5 [Pseudocyphellaria aurata]|nr:transcription elongation factor spt5 [Pseudocyphellaria aurata]